MVSTINRTNGAWDNLSMSEKADMIKVAVRNGITNLQEIRQKYNEFAGGGNLYAGTSTDDDLVDWIIREEGFNSKPEDIGDGKMTLGSGLTAKKWHDLYRKKGNKWSAADNRMAVAQEVADRRRWAEKNVPNWDTLPESSQKALLSYKYNYDFNAANSPKLFQALADSNLPEVARQMDATSKNTKFKRGLTDRRKREQEWFLKDVAASQEPATSSRLFDNIREIPVSTSVASPFVTDAPVPEYVRPVMVPDEGSYVKAHVQTPSEKRINNLRAFMQSLEDYDRMMSEYNVQNTPIYTFKAPYVVRSLGGNLNTNQYGNIFDDGGLFGNETVDTVASFLPVLGTVEDAYQFYKDPSWANAGWLALSLGSDIFTGGMASRAIKAARVANRAVDAANAVNRTARTTWNAGRRANMNQSGSVSGADMRRMIEAVKAAGATRNAAIRRANDALFDAGIKTAADQGTSTFLNAIQLDMLPDLSKHDLGGSLLNNDIAHVFEDGGEGTTAYTPIKNPIIPKVKDDQEAVNWIANWYNNRRKQLYNNYKDYDGTQVFLYDLKDRFTGTPVGRRAINHAYYDKLNKMAQYKTATFKDLMEDNPASYDLLKWKAFGVTVPETRKIYYDTELMQDASTFLKRQEGYSPLGIRIHERTHTSGKTGDDGKFTGYNAQTRALGNILRLKDGVEYDEYMDAMPEVYGRMMEFRYNHNMDPKKNYSKEEVKQLLDKENKEFKSDLQRYDLESLTKALNEVAQTDRPDVFNLYDFPLT